MRACEQRDVRTWEEKNKYEEIEREVARGYGCRGKSMEPCGHEKLDKRTKKSSERSVMRKKCRRANGDE